MYHKYKHLINVQKPLGLDSHATYRHLFWTILFLGSLYFEWFNYWHRNKSLHSCYTTHTNLVCLPPKKVAHWHATCPRYIRYTFGARAKNRKTTQLQNDIQVSASRSMWETALGGMSAVGNWSAHFSLISSDGRKRYGGALRSQLKRPINCMRDVLTLSIWTGAGTRVRHPSATDTQLNKRCQKAKNENGAKNWNPRERN